ncbi:MAG: M20 family peptidase [Bradymonadaceae bacterium]|nr:M20 family peptidase [Lujinxingiaceae bacterium]
MKKRALTGIVVFCGVLAIVLGIAIVRAATLSSKQIAVAPVEVVVDADAAARRLSQALQLATISTQATPTDPAPFLALHELLEQWYPRTHAALEREVVSQMTLHYTWRGSDPQLKHVVVLAHIDVVPVEPGTEGQWTHPAFSGAIEGGYVWGRGALDNKQNALGLMEATEILLANGHTPRRTVHFVFGHDEEIGGEDGAGLVARRLQEQGVELIAVFDEGLVITEGIVPGVGGPLALVGVAEKGYVSVELGAKSGGGHSSMPPGEDLSVITLARALKRLHAEPMSASFDGPAALMFDHVAPEMDFGLKLVFANRWLFGPLLLGQLEAKPSTNALVRTTMAPTMLSASQKENVLPQRSTAILNFRVHPRDSIEDVLEYARQTIDDPRVDVEAVGRFRSAASPLASLDGFGYQALQRAIREVFPGVPVAPGMMLGATDSRHFLALTPEVYRFGAATFRPEDLARLHGTDERIAVVNYGQLIAFWTRLLANVDKEAF